jgi:hypothetical protein
VWQEQQFVCSRGSRSQQRLEPGFAEVAVRRQGLTESQLAHDNEARTIGEGVGVIGVFPEVRPGLVEARRIDPFDPDAGALLDEIQDASRTRSATCTPLRAFASMTVSLMT